jgi:NodT family efflux transporter outer membrane factor (OMF) lipoprotein
MNRILLTMAAAVLAASCAVGPDYRRPNVPAPARFRGAAEPPAEVSLADLTIPEMFADPVLQTLLDEALRQNFDLRAASARVLEARAQLGVSRADFLPTLDARGQYAASRGSSVGSFVFVPRGTNLDVSYTQAGFGLNWELDLWGRIRRLNEAARAEYLASEEARNGVITTLVADVASLHYAIAELDAELAIARRTRAAAQASLELVTLRRDQGAGTGLDVRQAEQFLYTATAQIARIERALAQTENALSLLLGRSPGEVERGQSLEEWSVPPEVPAGLPSALLQRRPDIRQAEQELIAANARIGAARAQYFPQISLTGFLGGQSRALSDLFAGPARNWNLAPAAALPIFNAGRIRSTVRSSEARQQEALARYEQTIQTAFREVADALVEYRKTAEEREQQGRLVEALQGSLELSTLRYNGGLDSYLQVLDAQRGLFQGQLELVRLRQRELVAVVQLYRALGGGWER